MKRERESREPDPKPLTVSEPKPMVIDISSASDLFDVTVEPACPIDEEIKSLEVQQLEQELELKEMARLRKPLVPMTGSTLVPPLGLGPVSNLVQNPPTSPTQPIMELI